MLLLSWLVHDNPPGIVVCSQWVLWVWMLTVLPRMVCYFFRLVHLPRVGIVLGVCLALLFIWGVTRGRTTIHIDRIEIASPRLPAGFDGLRVVQFSDTHLGALVNERAEVGRIVDSINSLHPDLIVFSGDLVNIRSSELDTCAMRLLGGLHAPYGVVSITGNHDIGAYIKDTVSLPREKSLAQLIAKEKAMGWQVLNDTTVYLRRGGDSISLTGLAFKPELKIIRHDREMPDMHLSDIYASTPDTLYNMTAVHIPQLWSQIKAAGYGDLALAGHVHSMQMKLHLFGHEFSPAEWFYTQWSGRYDDAGKTLYINDGTGYIGFPMRLGAYPEISLITLKRCA